jgi:chemotaxis protein histidine kinase CheA
MNIVFNLVTGKLKGKIKLNSQPYEGCRLIITIPYTRLEPSVSHASSTDSAT